MLGETRLTLPVSFAPHKRASFSFSSVAHSTDAKLTTQYAPLRRYAPAPPGPSSAPRCAPRAGTGGCPRSDATGGSGSPPTRSCPRPAPRRSSPWPRGACAASRAARTRHGHHAARCGGRSREAVCPSEGRRPGGTGRGAGCAPSSVPARGGSRSTEWTACEAARSRSRSSTTTVRQTAEIAGTAAIAERSADSEGNWPDSGSPDP